MMMVETVTYKRHSIRDVRLRGGIHFRGSKATPAGAVAKLPPQGRQPQHATSGKKIRKTVTEVESRASSLALPRCSNVTESKDLGMIAKSYGYVYVAHEQNCQ